MTKILMDGGAKYSLNGAGVEELEDLLERHGSPANSTGSMELPRVCARAKARREASKSKGSGKGKPVPRTATVSARSSTK